VLGWWLLSLAGWRGVLALLPCLAAVGLAAAFLIQVETRPATTLRPGLDSVTALWKHRPSRWVALAFAAIGSVFFLMIAVVPAAVRDTTGFGDRGVALLMGGTYLGFLAGNLAVAATARWLDGLLLCACGAALAAGGVALMGMCSLVPSASLWAVALLAYSVGHGLIFPAALGRIMQAMPTRAGMAAAVTGMLPMLVGAGLCLIAALVPAHPAVQLMVVAVPVILLGTAALAVAWRDEHPPPGQAAPGLDEGETMRNHR